MEALEGTPVGAQRLLLRGVVLEDAGAPLGAYGFQEGDECDKALRSYPSLCLPNSKESRP